MDILNDPFFETPEHPTQYQSSADWKVNVYEDIVNDSPIPIIMTKDDGLSMLYNVTPDVFWRMEQMIEVFRPSWSIHISKFLINADVANCKKAAKLFYIGIN